MSAMTRAELLELASTQLTVDVETAGRAYGIGRAKAYRLAKAGVFPVAVLTVAGRYRVRTAALVADLLRTDESELTATASPDSLTSITGQEKEVETNAIPQHAA